MPDLRLIFVVLAVVATVLASGCFRQETHPMMPEQPEGLLTMLTLAEAESAFRRGDHRTAVRLYKEHAARGNLRAKYMVAVSYDFGWGVEEDKARAAGLYLEAANSGYPDAQMMLGLSYYDGGGVPKDYEASVRWLSRAAEQGNVSAQYFLAQRYLAGDGVRSDPVMAYVWLSRAAERSHKWAENERRDVRTKLTGEQLYMAQQLIADWKPTPERRTSWF